MAKIYRQKQVFDRKTFSTRLSALKEQYGPSDIRPALVDLFKEYYQQGFDEVRRRCETGANGKPLAMAQTFLTDEIILQLYTVTTSYIYTEKNRTSGERLSLVAIGGYGRMDMVPYSDVDLLFLLPYKQTPWGERVVEYILYMLWDIGFKVGHAVRTVNESIRLAREDLTIRTSLLESRHICADEELYEEFLTRYDKEVISGHEPEFVEEKLNERDTRHVKLGQARYVVEPNIKEGKGGLRDLQTLYWISKFIYGVHSVGEVVEKGIFSAGDYRQFQKAYNFLTTVRFHLHYVSERAEERISFGVQKILAERLGYADRAGLSGVERFMKHYFLTAKTVGDLTRIYCAYLEDKHKRKPRLRMPRFGLHKRKVGVFPVEGSRISLTTSKDLKDDPVNMIRIFHIAQQQDLDIHPRAMRRIRQNLTLVDRKLQKNVEANRLFMEILTFKDGPGFALRLMNEAGILGKFIPDFGRVVAQMQFDMYHVYTVDEHTIRAIELLSEVERGLLAEDHPLANDIVHKVLSREVLYVAVMLHDIAKGRKGDHSVLGEEVAKKLCPRMGLNAAQTETVAWLVRHHLDMTHVAFKRDLNDPKTISDFAQIIQSPERLRLLLVLTVVDIRAVGPKIWNGWKGQLLRELYYQAEEYLFGGHIETGNKYRIEAAKKDLQEELQDWTDEEFSAYSDRFYDSYWLALNLENQARNARLIALSDRIGEKLTINIHVDEFQSISELTIYAQDHPGLFARMTGAITISGASIQDAKIFTTKDGMALDTFWIQEPDGGIFKDKHKLARLKSTIERTLAGEILPRKELEALRNRPRAIDAFTVEPRVLIDNMASNRYTVVELNGLDRPGFLHMLSQALVDLKLSIGSAHVATFGERAVTVFFICDLFGHKVHNEAKLQKIREKLMEALLAGTKKTAGKKKTVKKTVVKKSTVKKVRKPRESVK
ncbi:[protein-PII] uridylyltransferase [Paremcibacter congregatus]|uniref:Bifunctional uridylyltransferase/uridylyl-removing enzyme n=1 Tax=Paremcibacter congregatus TaxID=2043170 RepID=A0A2G4YUI5_9PROT|nr:[protein-PII] uridylyltransferase [Paremcibacter congregatus]PHZ85999.1 [protein-PII] uridylyltransferase [Paremcibacter congregatus]QDE26964.1 [protein-PII] uridylyltransferase [Paremcibacter congregatus]